MTKTTTHAQACKKSLQSLFLLLQAIEESPGDATSIAHRRHLVAYDGGHGTEPIEHSTDAGYLREPHPLAYPTEEGERVGDFSLYDHYTATGLPVAGWAGVRVEENGTLSYVAPDGSSMTVVEPLTLGMTRDDDDVLAADWYSRDYAEHLDKSMPAADRERVGAVLEAAGKKDRGCADGVATCATTGANRARSWRVLPGDKLAGTRELAWPDIALAAMVRTGGLRIDPALLLGRFGILPDGTRPAIAPTSHC